MMTHDDPAERRTETEAALDLPALERLLAELDWQPVRGREPMYEVSRAGHVRKVRGPLLRTWENDQGYTLVRLSRPRRVERVHRLVAEAFVSNPERKPFVNHIDCNRSNNRAGNLEWCTQAQNLRHSDQLGRMQKDYWQGRRSPNARLTTEQVRQMRAMYEEGGVSWARVAAAFGVSKRCAGRVIKGEVYADVQ